MHPSPSPKAGGEQLPHPDGHLLPVVQRLGAGRRAAAAEPRSAAAGGAAAADGAVTGLDEAMGDGHQGLGRMAKGFTDVKILMKVTVKYVEIIKNQL